MQYVTGPNRGLPANLVQARGAEAGGGDRPGLEEQFERESDRLKSAGDEAAIDRGPGRLGIGMESLSVVEARELDDERLRDGEGRGLDAIARLEVLEISRAIAAHGRGSVSSASRRTPSRISPSVSAA